MKNIISQIQHSLNRINIKLIIGEVSELVNIVIETILTEIEKKKIGKK